MSEDDMNTIITNRILILFAVVLTLVGISVGAARAQFSILIPAQGGTGTSTSPTYGQMLVGTAAGVYQLQATSTLNITSIAIGTVSTSSVPTIGQLSYWASTGYPSLLGTVATTTLTASSPLSLSNPVAKVGGSNSVLTIDTSGTWSGNAGTATALAANGANCSAGNYPLGVNASGAVEDCTAAGTGTVTSIATTYPITGGTITTTGTLGIAFGTTTSNTWAGLQTFGNATTSLLTVSGSIWLTGITSAIPLTDSTGLVAEYAGTSCTNQFVRSLSALGAATCATVANTDLANSTISGIALGSNLADLTATDGSLTFSGTYNGSTARTIGLNVGNANTWIVLQTFSFASTTRISATGELLIPASADPTVDASPVSGTSKVAIDTTAASTSIRANIGGTEYAFYTDKEGTFEIASTTLSAENRTFSGNATSTYDFWRPSRKTQINSFACKSNAALLVRIGDGSASTTQVSASAGWTEATSLSNNLFNRNEQIYFEVGTSTTANKLRCRVNYTTQAE